MLSVLSLAIDLDYAKLMVTYNGQASRVCTRSCESSTIVPPVAKAYNLILGNAQRAREFSKKIADNSCARYRSRIPF